MRCIVQLAFFVVHMMCKHHHLKINLYGKQKYFTHKQRKIYIFEFKTWHQKAPPRFELGISCLLDRRFNQLSHDAALQTSSHYLASVNNLIITEVHNTFYTTLGSLRETTLLLIVQTMCSTALLISLNEQKMLLQWMFWRQNRMKIIMLTT